MTAVPEAGEAGSDSGSGDGETHPSDSFPARFPQSISREAGGLLPEAEGPALQDEDEALREFGLRSLGGDPEYWDDVSGASLPAEAVKAARAEEVAFMEGWKCWQRVPYEEAVRCGGRKPIATRWVDVNKGDEATPDVRSRLVAKDFAGGHRDDAFFAATPSA